MKQRVAGFVTYAMHDDLARDRTIEFTNEKSRSKLLERLGRTTSSQPAFPDLTKAGIYLNEALMHDDLHALLNQQLGMRA